MTAHASTWPARSASCTRTSAPSYRVEAVDTSTHWPAVYLADARDPARARLVPAGRLPAERGALRQARREGVSRLAARARREVRRALALGARLQRARRGAALRSGRSRVCGRSSRRRARRSTRCRTRSRSSPARVQPRLTSLAESRIGVACTAAGRTGSRCAGRRTGTRRSAASKGKDGMLRLTTRTRASTVRLDVRSVERRARARTSSPGEQPSCQLPQ